MALLLSHCIFSLTSGAAGCASRLRRPRRVHGVLDPNNNSAKKSILQRDIHYLRRMDSTWERLFLFKPSSKLCSPGPHFSLGSLFILLLYALILSRIIRIGHMTRSNFGKLYCYSFATAFFIYVAVNMMMVLGLLPIVGSPLPIMSYGGSSMMAIMFGLGIVMSCKIYKDVPVN